MSKHAYLIIAHHEFSVLECLVSLLDDVRNDIYIHFDKKVKVLPTISTQKSTLYILNERIDVRWGNVSQIESELVLFRHALRNRSSRYQYFHLLSGVHLPLKSQDTLHRFFEEKYPLNILESMPTTIGEVDLKLRTFNLFTKYFMMPNHPKIQRTGQFAWKVCVRIQKILNIKTNKSHHFTKAANWVSLSEDAVSFLVERASPILKKYKYTLCGDEFFVPSELSVAFRESIIHCDHYLKTEFLAESPKIYTKDDFIDLIRSPYLFARKFGTKDLPSLDMLTSSVQKID